PVWRTKSPKIWAAYVVYAFMVAASFVVLYELVIRAQSVDAGAGTRAYWANAFPPRGSVLKLVIWLVQVHTSHMMSYPIGGERGASAVTTICVALAAVVLWRRGRKSLLAILLAPLGLGFVAACVGGYPYGGSARTMQYIAPAICLMTGLGGAALLARL